MPSTLPRDRVSVLRQLLFVLLLAICAPAATAATYHVRTDGGDASQCTGRADTPYPGSGTGQACAWKHVYYALPTTGSPRISGGDTLIIGPGSYMIGWGAPGSSGGRCYAGGPYDCYLPPIPSGPNASSPTRILGQSGPSGCTAPPKLWGNERVSKVLNLEGSSNVEVGCLEITDQSDCVEFHGNSSARCQRDNPPYGQWASIGISAKASRSVWLHDIDVHGLAHTGIHAGGLTDWTLDRVKINGNGWVGWDGDIGSGSSNSGQIVMRQIQIAWNGCGERWQTGVYWACWAQQAGGYGDGLGTATTGGQWLIEDAFVHHNTSDGLDLLYLDGAAGTSVVMRRVYAFANAGNQLKTRGNATVENSVVVGQCGYFSGRDFMVNGDHCRALGNALSLTMGANHTVNVRHNTITGEGDCLLLTSGGASSSRANIQNNALVGQPELGTGELTCGHYADNSSAVVAFSGNLFWNVKANQCPAGGNTCGQNPKLANLSLAAFNPEPLAGSPLIDRAPAISGLNTDFYLQARPRGVAPDIGAVETSGATVVADFNGDGVSDVLWRNNPGGGNVIWNSANYGSPVFMQTIPGIVETIAAVGDFDGSGTADVMWRNTLTGANVIWRDGQQGSPTFLRAVADQAWKVVGSGDFDGDGKSDLLWRHGVTGGNVIWHSAAYATSRSLTAVTDADWIVAGVGDFNGDGRSDILWQHRVTRANVVWYSGDYSSSQQLVTVGDAAWKISGVGDFDGDGRSDILWRNAATGGNVAWRSANYGTPMAMAGVGDLNWKISGVGDFDGDGRSDVLWRNAATGGNVIWRGASYQTPQFMFTVTDLAWGIVAR